MSQQDHDYNARFFKAAEQCRAIARRYTEAAVAAGRLADELRSLASASVVDPEDGDDTRPAALRNGRALSPLNDADHLATAEIVLHGHAGAWATQARAYEDSIPVENVEVI